MHLVNALCESQQWSVADDLTPALADGDGMWDITPSTRLTPQDCRTVSQYLSHVKSHPIDKLHINCDKLPRGGLRAAVGGEATRGYTGLQLTFVHDEYWTITGLMSGAPNPTSLIQ